MDERRTLNNLNTMLLLLLTLITGVTSFFAVKYFSFTENAIIKLQEQVITHEIRISVIESEVKNGSDISN